MGENGTNKINWKYSRSCKGILIVIMQFLTALLALSITVVFSYSSFRTEGISMLRDPEFETSQVMAEMMQNDAINAASFIVAQSNFETEGKYDGDKLVDIEQYYSDGVISGAVINGLAYKISQLRDWSEKFNYSGSQNTQKVRVCEKMNGTYYYYTQKEFINLIEVGRIYLFNQESGKCMRITDENKSLMGSSEYIEGSTSVEVIEGGASAIPGIEAAGGIVYLDTWNLEIVNEKYAPEGYRSILALANSNSIVNGNLEEYNRALTSVLNSFNYSIESYEENKRLYAEGNTNFTYVFVNQDTKDVYTNVSAYSDYNNLDATKGSIRSLGRFIFIDTTLSNSETNTVVSMESVFQNLHMNLNNGNYTVYLGLNTSFPIQDTYYETMQSYEKYAPWFSMILLTAFVSFIGLIILMMWITIAAGRTSGEAPVVLNWFDRIPLELDAGFCMLIAGMGGYTFLSHIYNDTENYYTVYNDPSSYFSPGKFLLMAFCAAVAGLAALSLYLTVIRRIKAKHVWHGTLMYYIGRGIWRIYENRKAVTKTIFTFVAFMLYNIAAFSSRTDIWIVIAIILDTWMFIFIVRSAIARQRIVDGIQRIAGGDLDTQIDTDGLKGDEFLMAEAVNHLGEGMQKAVDNNMKTERLKTDLITNVSHDIKTPLTTIINYVDILKRSDIDDPKLQSYIDILERKSQRLKHLTEDLVEASKISSGNIELQFMLLNYSELICQAAGECEEKLNERRLTLIMNLPEEPVTIMADGRRLFRVLENLFINAAKYAMPDTRVYVDLVVTKERKAQLLMKNVSEQQLNIQADELTERFIRGDLSRSSEGSGLGLSIARTLTELQHGEFEIYLDGDLFRVMVSFPVYVKPPIKISAKTDGNGEASESQALE